MRFRAKHSGRIKCYTNVSIKFRVNNLGINCQTLWPSHINWTNANIPRGIKKQHVKPAPKADCKFCNVKVGTSVRRRGVIFQGKHLHVVRSIPKICVLQDYYLGHQPLHKNYSWLPMSGCGMTGTKSCVLNCSNTALFLNLHQTLYIQLNKATR